MNLVGPTKDVMKKNVASHLFPGPIWPQIYSKPSLTFSEVFRCFLEFQWEQNNHTLLKILLSTYFHLQVQKMLKIQCSLWKNLLYQAASFFFLWRAWHWRSIMVFYSSLVLDLFLDLLLNVFLWRINDLSRYISKDCCGWWLLLDQLSFLTIQLVQWKIWRLKSLPLSVFLNSHGYIIPPALPLKIWYFFFLINWP